MWIFVGCGVLDRELIYMILIWNVYVEWWILYSGYEKKIIL